MKMLIEKALPLKALSMSATSDKACKGHPGNMHLWWNRSPIDSSAALLRAIIENTSSDGQCDSKIAPEIIAELINIANGTNEKITCLNGDDYPIICEPFSGFGGLAIAAQKIGLNVQAGDLNAVATLLTKTATEIPSLFADCNAVNPAGKNNEYFGAAGLAADVKYYGDWLREHAKKELSDTYPDMYIDGELFAVYSWIWVRTMKCPNPACGCQMPMAGSYILSKLKGKEYWAEPVIENKKIRFLIHHGICPKDKETNKFGSNGAKFKCIACGAITRDEDVKKAGKSGALTAQVMAVSVHTSSGRIFVEPDEIQSKAAKAPIPEDVPIASIPNNSRWFSPPGFGMFEYVDIYTSRQLVLMTTLCNLIPKIIDKVASDALLAGMSPVGVGLNAGGNGALAYGQAIGVYLSLVVGKLANFQSTICTWDNRNGNIRASFTRQAIPMTWVFAEGNPFSSVTGNYDTMLRNVYESVAELHTGHIISVKQSNAVTMQFPQNSILFTELPYYDNVGYADLSDYFYIWLRKCLRNVYPELFENVVTSKEELSSIPEHYNGDSVAAIIAYRDGIQQLFKNFYDAASKDYPSIVFYEYSKQDTKNLDAVEKSNEFTSIEFLLDSLIKAGFMVTAIWPIKTEKPNLRFKSLRIAVVFRKRSVDSQNITRRGAITILKRELPKILNAAFEADIDEQDQPIIGLGLGLSILTRYRKVINADGSDMDIRDALQLIHQETIDYINVHSIVAQLEGE